MIQKQLEKNDIDEHLSDNSTDSDDNAADNDDEVANRQNRYPKRMLTYQRKVHSIDSALDEDNYTPMELPEEQRTLEGIVKGDRSTPDVVHKFTNQKPNDFGGRQRIADILHGTPGPLPVAKITNEPVDAFKMYMTDEMIGLIVRHTNEKITLLVSNASAELLTKNPFLKITTTSEIHAFFGLMLYRGLYKLNTFTVQRLFSKRYGPPIFSATMARNRFLFLIATISFDDETTRADRWKQDRFTAIRELLELFNNQCMTCIRAGDYLSLDETLYPMRTQVAFKQFNPSKPAKYGLLFKSINAARYPYTFVTAPYAGKPQEEGGEYYFPGTENITKYLIDRLDGKQALHGRNISFDRLYTSFTLATWLFKEKHVTCVGTLMTNRKGIPADLKKVDQREVLSSEFYWHEHLVLGSYVVSSSTKKKKNVLMLTTLRPILGTTIDDGKNKPALYKLYDFTKGGTDIVDQRMGFYSCKFKARRWSMTAFAYIVDTARVNASTLFAMNQKKDPLKLNSFEFGMDVVFGLISPFLKQRNKSRLSPIIKKKMALTLAIMGCDDEEAVVIREDHQLFGPSKSKKRKRCNTCIDEMTPAENQNTISPDNMLCQQCGTYICTKHCVRKCINCASV